MKLGNTVTKRRERKRLSVRQVAELAGISHQAIANLESGTVESPGLLYLRRVADALDTTVGELLIEAGLEKERTETAA